MGCRYCLFRSRWSTCNGGRPAGRLPLATGRLTTHQVDALWCLGWRLFIKTAFVQWKMLFCMAEQEAVEEICWCGSFVGKLPMKLVSLKRNDCDLWLDSLAACLFEILCVCVCVCVCVYSLRLRPLYAVQHMHCRISHETSKPPSELMSSFILNSFSRNEMHVVTAVI